jgi:hypothetical protein
MPTIMNTLITMTVIPMTMAGGRRARMLPV